VCSRAKHHFDPEAAAEIDLDFSHSAGDLGSAAGSEGPTLERYKQLFKPLNPHTARMMYCESPSSLYWSVSVTLMRARSLMNMRLKDFFLGLSISNMLFAQMYCYLAMDIILEHLGADPCRIRFA
jgi:hypothetical protein